MCNESLRNYKPQEVLHRGVASDQGEQDLTLVANPHTYLGHQLQAIGGAIAGRVGGGHR